MIALILIRIFIFLVAGAALAALTVALYVYWPRIVAAALEQQTRLRQLRRRRDLRDQ